jgi:predicted O-methyltransferase YrrM
MSSIQYCFANRATRVLNRWVQRFLIERSLQRRGLKRSRTIPTFTHREELEALFKLANECPPNARVLEIGSYLGASTCYIAGGMRGENASIVCVDTWQNQTMPEGVRETLGEFKLNVKAIRSQLTLIRKDSNDVSSSELGGSFDLIFLDGDHSYAQTKADFELVSAFLASNGMLVFHDSFFYEGVSRVIGEALASGEWQVSGMIRNLFWIKRAKFANPS